MLRSRYLYGFGTTRGGNLAGEANNPWQDKVPPSKWLLPWEGLRPVGAKTTTTTTTTKTTKKEDKARTGSQ